MSNFHRFTQTVLSRHDFQFLSLQHRTFSTEINYVPKHSSPRDADLERLYQFLRSTRRLFVITGAGVSTESGLPDYRSEGTGLVARRPNFKPTNYQDFMRKESTRRIYWARSFAAWGYHTKREPNLTHYTLANWETRGRLAALVTQNVDRLHQRAGSKNVTELHGTLYQVRCMACERLIDRFEFQNMLRTWNRDAIQIDFETKALRPDGDVELSLEVSSNFRVPPCQQCGSGVLKPNVVFYGENVPSVRKDAVRRSIERSDAVLVLGTTLHTRSGRDHVEYAYKSNLPIALVNIGPSYGDPWASVRLDARCGEVMKILVQEGVMQALQ